MKSWLAQCIALTHESYPILSGKEKIEIRIVCIELNKKFIIWGVCNQGLVPIIGLQIRAANVCGAWLIARGIGMVHGLKLTAIYIIKICVQLGRAAINPLFLEGSCHRTWAQDAWGTTVPSRWLPSYHDMKVQQTFPRVRCCKARWLADESNNCQRFDLLPKWSHIAPQRSQSMYPPYGVSPNAHRLQQSSCDVFQSIQCGMWHQIVYYWFFMHNKPETQKDNFDCHCWCTGNDTSYPFRHGTLHTESLRRNPWIPEEVQKLGTTKSD